MDCEKLGARLSQGWQEADLSMRCLSTRSEASSSTLGYIEQGRQYPSVETLEQIAGTLGVSPCWFSYCIGKPEATS